MATDVATEIFFLKIQLSQPFTFLSHKNPLKINISHGSSIGCCVATEQRLLKSFFKDPAQPTIYTLFNGYYRSNLICNEKEHFSVTVAAEYRILTHEMVGGISQ